MRSCVSGTVFFYPHIWWLGLGGKYFSFRISTTSLCCSMASRVAVEKSDGILICRSSQKFHLLEGTGAAHALFSGENFRAWWVFAMLGPGAAISNEKLFSNRSGNLSSVITLISHPHQFLTIDSLLHSHFSELLFLELLGVSCWAWALIISFFFPSWLPISVTCVLFSGRLSQHYRTSIRLNF